MLYLPFIIFPTLFLNGLIIEIYFRRVLGHTPLAKHQVVLFCLPAFITFWLQIGMFASFSEFRDTSAVYQQRGVVKPYSLALVASALAYNLMFSYVSSRKLPGFRFWSRSTHEPHDDRPYAWLRSLLVFNATLNVAGLLSVGYNLLAPQAMPASPLTAVLFTGGNYLIIFFLIRQPTMFGLSHDNRENSPKAKYAKIPAIDANVLRQYAEMIQRHLVTTKPFLKEVYTVNHLAAEVDIPAHIISMVINSELQQNFYTLINTHRVQVAKELLLSDTQPNVLEIAYASGFQSKSAFNKVFKQFTGQTPSNFRNP